MLPFRGWDWLSWALLKGLTLRGALPREGSPRPPGLKASSRHVGETFIGKSEGRKEPTTPRKEAQNTTDRWALQSSSAPCPLERGVLPIPPRSPNGTLQKCGRTRGGGHSRTWEISSPWDVLAAPRRGGGGASDPLHCLAQACLCLPPHAPTPPAKPGAVTAVSRVVRCRCVQKSRPNNMKLPNSLSSCSSGPARVKGSGGGGAGPCSHFVGPSGGQLPSFSSLHLSPTEHSCH